jgi:hypothetical protein
LLFASQIISSAYYASYIQLSSTVPSFKTGPLLLVPACKSMEESSKFLNTGICGLVDALMVFRCFWAVRGALADGLAVRWDSALK